MSTSSATDRCFEQRNCFSSIVKRHVTSLSDRISRRIEGVYWLTPFFSTRCECVDETKRTIKSRSLRIADQHKKLFQTKKKNVQYRCQSRIRRWNHEECRRWSDAQASCSQWRRWQSSAKCGSSEESTRNGSITIENNPDERWHFSEEISELYFLTNKPCREKEDLLSSGMCWESKALLYDRAEDSSSRICLPCNVARLDDWIDRVWRLGLISLDILSSLDEQTELVENVPSPSISYSLE